MKQKLKDIAVIKRGKHFSKDNEGGDYLLLVPKNISKNNQLILKDNKFVTSPNESDLIQQGDLIMNVTGNIKTIGNFYVYDLPMKAVASDHMVIIKSKDNKISDKLSSKYYNIKLLVTGSTINKVNIKDLEDLEV